MSLGSGHSGPVSLCSSNPDPSRNFLLPFPLLRLPLYTVRRRGEVGPIAACAGAHGEFWTAPRPISGAPRVGGTRTPPLFPPPPLPAHAHTRHPEAGRWDGDPGVVGMWGWGVSRKGVGGNWGGFWGFWGGILGVSQSYGVRMWLGRVGTARWPPWGPWCHAVPVRRRMLGWGIWGASTRSWLRPHTVPPTHTPGLSP